MSEHRITKRLLPVFTTMDVLPSTPLANRYWTSPRPFDGPERASSRWHAARMLRWRGAARGSIWRRHVTECGKSNVRGKGKAWPSLPRSLAKGRSCQIFIDPVLRNGIRAAHGWPQYNGDDNP